MLHWHCCCIFLYKVKHTFPNPQIRYSIPTMDGFNFAKTQPRKMVFSSSPNLNPNFSKNYLQVEMPVRKNSSFCTQPCLWSSHFPHSYNLHEIKIVPDTDPTLLYSKEMNEVQWSIDNANHLLAIKQMPPFSLASLKQKS